MNALSLLTILVTICGVALGRYPQLRMNRATIALVGATLLVALGTVSLDQAYHALDLNTLTLLLGMMIINANLRLSGFFQLVSDWIGRRAASPRRLLAWIIFSSGSLSALLLNDTVVLMFTPLIIGVVTSLKRNPVPYLIGLVTAANIGSAGTMVGNPQNILIGATSGISFVSFSAALLPPAFLGLAVAWMVLTALYRQEFRQAPLEVPQAARPRVYRPLLKKSLLSVGGMVTAFLAGVPVALAAMGAAAFLLVTRRLKPARVFREIDWSLLVFFSGLFVVTRALETGGFSERLFQLSLPVARAGILSLAATAAGLSNIISNVPAVMIFSPWIPDFPNPRQAWLTLALATTFAGNLTLLGSVANLIVAESAAHLGVNLTFTEYLKSGVLITALTLAIGVLWLGIAT